jgi:hypothetical protein
MYLTGAGCKGLDETQVVQERIMVGSCEHGNEASENILGRKSLDQLGDNQFLKDSTPWSCSF